MEIFILFIIVIALSILTKSRKSEIEQEEITGDNSPINNLASAIAIGSLVDSRKMMLFDPENIPKSKTEQSEIQLSIVLETSAFLIHLVARFLPLKLEVKKQGKILDEIAAIVLSILNQKLKIQSNSGLDKMHTWFYDRINTREGQYSRSTELFAQDPITEDGIFNQAILNHLEVIFLNSNNELSSKYYSEIIEILQDKFKTIFPLSQDLAALLMPQPVQAECAPFDEKCWRFGSDNVYLNFVYYCRLFLVDRIGLTPKQAHLLSLDPEFGDKIDYAKNAWLEKVGNDVDPEDTLKSLDYNSPKIQELNDVLKEGGISFSKREGSIISYLFEINHPIAEYFIEELTSNQKN